MKTPLASNGAKGVGLFEHIKEEQFPREMLVFLHGKDLGMSADLFQQQLARGRFPALARGAEYEIFAVDNALQPQIAAADSKLGALKIRKGNFRSYVQLVVYANQTILFDLGNITRKA